MNILITKMFYFLNLNIIIFICIIVNIIVCMFLFIHKKYKWILLFFIILFIFYEWINIGKIYATEHEFKLFRILKNSMIYHLLGNMNEIPSYTWWLCENTNDKICRIPFGNINMGYKGIKCDGFKFCTISQMIIDKYEFKNFIMVKDLNLIIKIKNLLIEYNDMKIIIFSDNAQYILEVINKMDNNELKELINKRLFITDGKKLFSRINEEILNKKISNTTEQLRSFLSDKKNIRLDEIIREVNNYDNERVSKALDLKNYEKAEILSCKWDKNNENYNTHNILKNKIKERNFMIEAVKNLIDNKK